MLHPHPGHGPGDSPPPHPTRVGRDSPTAQVHRGRGLVPLAPEPSENGSGANFVHPFAQLASRTRFRSNANDPLPYIILLINLILVFCPSTTPELHGSVSPAVTAASSRRSPAANDTSRGTPQSFTSLSQTWNASPPSLLRTMVANLRARSRVAASSGQRSHTSSSCCTSAASRWSGGRRTNPAMLRGDGGARRGSGGGAPRWRAVT